jgi:hypothetical protein
VAYNGEIDSGWRSGRRPEQGSRGAEDFVGDEDGGDAGSGEALEEPGEVSPRGNPGSGASALLDRLAEVRSNLARERDGAPALWLELASLPPDRRPAAVSGEARFHTFGVCELLLAKAAGLTGADPAEAGRLAALALAAAEHLDSALHPEPVVHDLQARAWAVTGESRRAAGELRGAEEALAEAAACLAHGTGDLTVDARLLEFEAAVRADQGRLGEADALLRQAAARYARVNEPELETQVKARREGLRRAARAASDPGHPAFGTGS